MNTFFERLKQERKRLGFNQTEFAAFGGVQKGAQVNYEAGERNPDAGYLAAIAAKGADVLWIITGEREFTPPQALSAEEQTLLAYFRAASSEVRRAALGALLGASVPSKTGDSSVRQNSTGTGAVQVGRAGGSVHIYKGKSSGK